MPNMKTITMRKPLWSYRAVIFDVDGTMYSQLRLRKHMALSLLCSYGLRPWRLKELWILRKYRQIREHWNELDLELTSFDIDTAQYAYVAKHFQVSEEKVKNIVCKWIHTLPLSYLPRCLDRELADIIKLLRIKGIITAAYSDYPVADKLEAMGIIVDYAFSSSDKLIGCMKPDPRGMKAVLHSIDVLPEDTLMIGDRLEKDGESAKNTGMDYLILDKSMPDRHHLYKQLLEGHWKMYD